MHAFVYKSQRKEGTYIYLARRDDFQVLPAPLAQSLGPLQFVLEVALTEDRRLAVVDPVRVRDELTRNGFFLQVPPSVVPMLARHYD